jgi:DinB superfamily
MIEGEFMKNPLLTAAATLLALGIAHTGSAQGQQGPGAPPAGPQSPSAPRKLTLANGMIGTYTFIQSNLLEAAELMPEAGYLFKPTPETRPFGQLVSHLALSQFDICSVLQGGPSPKAGEKEETPRSKAALLALLKESAAFCNPLVNAMTDEGMVRLVKAGPVEGAAGLVVAGLNTHGNEMYGTIAVYLRLKGIVPPTTARERLAQTKRN